MQVVQVVLVLLEEGDLLLELVEGIFVPAGKLPLLVEFGLLLAGLLHESVVDNVVVVEGFL